MSAPTPSVPPRVTFSEAFRYWLRLGFVNFGGPTGQIAMMHRDLVEERRWISDNRFLHALNYCMLLPGPEAQQLAIYIGWLLHGAWGGIVAGLFFILPSVFLLWGLSWLYMAYGSVAWVAALFYGVKPAVVAIVGEAVIRIGRRALQRPIHFLTAAAAFLALFFFRVPFPLVILAAITGGFLLVRVMPRWFDAPSANGGGSDSAVLGDEDAVRALHQPTWGRASVVVVVCLALWVAPLVAVRTWLGPDSTVFQEGVFFSKAAMITFGGAYAVLSYVAQQAVEHYGWLMAPQMLDGLGLAESTPGPLIMVTQFVGFVGAWRHPGHLSPLAAATLGASFTTWVTFVPCFLWIFLGAPWIERLRSFPGLNSAMSLVTAAVVGVILNLAVYFARHVIFPERLDAFALFLALAVFAALLRWKNAMIPALGAGALLGLLWKVLT